MRLRGCPAEDSAYDLAADAAVIGARREPPIKLLRAGKPGLTVATGTSAAWATDGGQLRATH